MFWYPKNVFDVQKMFLMSKNGFDVRMQSGAYKARLIDGKLQMELTPDESGFTPAERPSGFAKKNGFLNLGFEKQIFRRRFKRFKIFWNVKRGEAPQPKMIFSVSSFVVVVVVVVARSANKTLKKKLNRRINFFFKNSFLFFVESFFVIILELIMICICTDVFVMSKGTDAEHKNFSV